MMATGFMGYVLPWGQMSYWAATVITNLFSAIPVFGEAIVTWLWGGFAVGNPTLVRFFSLHYLLPFVIVGVVVLHVWALHVVGQNNPAGVDPKTERETVPFTPYAAIKDSFFIVAFCILFAWFVFYVPNYLGHADNYIPANPAVTPTHIVPEWYYLPFYAILRSIPSKLFGVIALFSSIILLAFLPWLDTPKVKSATYRPLYKQFFWLFVATGVGLGWLGSQPPEGIYVIVSRLLTAWYFIHLLIVLPVLGLVERPTLRHARPRSLEAIGKGTRVAVLLALAVGAATFAGAPRPAMAQEGEQPNPSRNTWSFAGIFGRYDTAQLQRGFKVYHDVCQRCHSLSLLTFGNLGQGGGPQFTAPEVVAIASEYMVTDGPNTMGDMFQRPGRPADHFPPPFANPQQAAFALGMAPPDMSVLAKARQFERGFPLFLVDLVVPYQELGVDYIVAVLTGYGQKPADMTMAPGMQYNKFFPGHAIGMPPPLTDGVVTYTDGSPQTVDQYAKDGAAFLMWAAEPSLDARKRPRLPPGHDFSPGADGPRLSFQKEGLGPRPLNQSMTPASGKAVLGIIGGSGIYDLPGLENVVETRVASPWGEPSAALRIGEIAGLPVVFLSRHDKGHRLSPTDINYRANIDVLKRAGVTDLVSLSACGSFKEELMPGTFVLVDQFIDRTYRRESSFFGKGCVAHVSMAHPVSPRLHIHLAAAAEAEGIRFARGGTYVCMEGPQFSSLAESLTYKQQGYAVIGMTNMPEAKLAREAELCYATVAMVTDFDCWHPDHDAVTVQDIIKILNANAEKASRLVARLAADFPRTHEPCPIGSDRALDTAIITAPEARDPALLAKLDAIAARVLGT